MTLFACVLGTLQLLFFTNISQGDDKNFVDAARRAYIHNYSNLGPIRCSVSQRLDNAAYRESEIQEPLTADANGDVPYWKKPPTSYHGRLFMDGRKVSWSQFTKGETSGDIPLADFSFDGVVWRFLDWPAKRLTISHIDSLAKGWVFDIRNFGCDHCKQTYLEILSDLVVENSELNESGNMIIEGTTPNRERCVIRLTNDSGLPEVITYYSGAKKQREFRLVYTKINQYHILKTGTLTFFDEVGQWRQKLLYTCFAYESGGSVGNHDFGKYDNSTDLEIHDITKAQGMIVEPNEVGNETENGFARLGMILACVAGVILLACVTRQRNQKKN